MSRSVLPRVRAFEADDVQLPVEPLLDQGGGF